MAIRLCEVMQLNPIPILMFMTIYSNIGKIVNVSNNFDSVWNSKQSQFMIFNNIFYLLGGAMTPVVCLKLLNLCASENCQQKIFHFFFFSSFRQGDPPNVIIASQHKVIKSVSHP